MRMLQYVGAGAIARVGKGKGVGGGCEGEVERGEGGGDLVLKHSRRANHLERSVTLLVRVQLGRGQGVEGIDDWNRYLNLNLYLYLSLPQYLNTSVPLCGYYRSGEGHFSLHFTLCLVAVSCSSLRCSALLCAALRCSPLCYLQSVHVTCGTDFASNSPPCHLSNAIGRPLPRCSEVWCAVRGARCPAPV
jgi:hypothetical protein